MNRRVFEWDTEYLQSVTLEAIKSAKARYNKYLGDGSPLQTHSDVYFMRLLDLASNLSQTAGCISPSLRALSGVVSVSTIITIIAIITAEQ